ncbi:MAG: chemotaxis protein CheA [Euryarchaeota archaeon]|nr:chemotaxis protein CheA [Euryarchaeota archaeon]
MNTQKYMAMFLEEAEEHLQNLGRLLVELEAEPDRGEALQEVFRSVHTLKGLASTMGLEKIATLTHRLENLVEEMKREGIKQELMDLLFEGVDLLEEMLRSGEVDAELDAFLGRLQGREAGEGRGGRRSPFRELISGGIRPNYELRVWIEEGEVLKSVRAFTVLKCLSGMGYITGTFPEPERLEEESFDRSFVVRLRSRRSMQEIREAVEGLPEIERVEVREVERSGERRSQSIRVSTSTLDALMNITGELIINRSVLEDIARRHGLEELQDALDMTRRLTSELQFVVMKARMVPLGYIFSSFPRMVREAARREGKEVEFAIYGGEIELDRAVIDEIVEPLVHILRNAISHGIETPEERERAGKPRRGRITLSAVKERDGVVISVEDDGRGIQLDRVREEAVRRGLVGREKAEAMSREEVLKLLFLPGFSTAGRVTELSGRGVGLDAVKGTVEALGGHVEVETTPGGGTRVSLHLPLTMAILQAMLVRVDGIVCGVPIANVARVLESSSIITLHRRRVVRLGEDYVPVENLFGGNGGRYVLVLEKGSMRRGIVVEEVLGIQEVVLKPLSGEAAKLREFSGGTILGNGEVALMLDVGSIVGLGGGSGSAGDE